MVRSHQASDLYRTVSGGEGGGDTASLWRTRFCHISTLVKAPWGAPDESFEKENFFAISKAADRRASRDGLIARRGRPEVVSSDAFQRGRLRSLVPGDDYSDGYPEDRSREGARLEGRTARGALTACTTLRRPTDDLFYLGARAVRLAAEATAGHTL